jgi:hypothetical protein
MALFAVRLHQQGIGCIIRVSDGIRRGLNCIIRVLDGIKRVLDCIIRCYNY